MCPDGRDCQLFDKCSPRQFGDNCPCLMPEIEATDDRDLDDIMADNERGFLRGWYREEG